METCWTRQNEPINKVIEMWYFFKILFCTSALWTIMIEVNTIIFFITGYIQMILNY